MKVNKFEMLFNLVERWLTLHEEGKTIPQILAGRGIHTISIYGLGKIGKHMLWELRDSEVTVLYMLDRARTGICDGIPVKKAEEELPEVDAVIVTAVYEYDEIEKMLAARVSCPVISLEEILYEG